MASVIRRPAAAASVKLPECPVCMEIFSEPIFQCQSGHSLCNTCTTNMRSELCPICRQPMTKIRNRELEAIIAKAQVPCPNNPKGCVYKMINSEVEDHLKECIFREMDCPLGVFGRCSWQGQLKEMMAHFKERHPTNCNLSSDTDVELENVSVSDDDRHVYLYNQGKMLFIITVKIDTLQKMTYWAIQHVGGKRTAYQHVYEMHITSKQDPRRKTVFVEHCFNDAIKADEVFRLGKCGVLPLGILNHYIKDRKLSFRFFVKRIPTGQTEKKQYKNDENNPRPNGPGPQQKKAPQGPKPKPAGPNVPSGPHPRRMNNRKP